MQISGKANGNGRNRATRMIPAPPDHHGNGAAAPKAVRAAGSVSQRLAMALYKAKLLPDAGALSAFLAAPAERFASPLESFDPVFYRSQLPPGFAPAANPLLHYLEAGHQAMLSPHPCFDLDLLCGSGGARPAPRIGPAVPPPLLTIMEARASPYATPNVLFEPEIYVRFLPRDALGGLPPFEHFLRFWQDHRVPFSRYFDVAFYARTHRHILRSGINPLLHYMTQPVEARSDPNPMIHAKYYAASQNHVWGDPLIHYIRFGIAGGCLPNPYAEQELRRQATDHSRGFFAQLLDDYVSIPIQ
jgi:hypothetical protein